MIVVEIRGLDPAEAEALRRRLDEEIDAEVAVREEQADQVALIDAVELARRLGRSRDFVYDHADELGAIRYGTGPRSRLLFDPVNIRPAPSPPAVAVLPAPAAPRPRRRPSRPSGGLLQVRGERP
jgi:hypothetical protein